MMLLKTDNKSDEEIFTPTNVKDKPSAISQIDFEEEMLTLYQSISTKSNSQSKVISFISSNSGEGTTTIVQKFAAFLAQKLEKMTLILDADYSSQSKSLSILSMDNIDYGLDEVITEDKPLSKALFQVDNISLYISPLTKYTSPSPLIFDSHMIADFFKNLRQRFDFILIDSPAITLATEGLILTSLADEVIMILEADKTNWKVAEKTKERIIKNGGKISGIVFNKKRSYLPDFIDKLF